MNKKVLTLILCAALCTAMTACTKSSEASTTENSVSEAQDTSSESKNHAPADNENNAENPAVSPNFTPSFATDGEIDIQETPADIATDYPFTTEEWSGSPAIDVYPIIDGMQLKRNTPMADIFAVSGWNFDVDPETATIDARTELVGGVKLTNGSTVISINVINSSDDEILIKDGVVGDINIKGGFNGIVFPGDVGIGSTADEVVTAFGTPSKKIVVSDSTFNSGLYYNLSDGTRLKFLYTESDSIITEIQIDNS